jgi:GT2 family glycosyltransferase
MLKTISVIIPVKPGNNNPRVLEYVKRSDYPKEIIVVSGNNPSLQRNRGAYIAKGDIVYFFNDDTRVPPDAFPKIIDIFNKRQDIAGVGGPDLTPADNKRLQHLFGYAMSSYFAHWKMRARYIQVGSERLSNERELLLSNMAVRRDAFLKLEGFNGKLYPNEENELINRMCKAGYKFVYSPEVKIHRDRRRTLGAFLKQFYRYGQGRMDQISLEGTLANLQFFAPLLLLVYLLMLPLLSGMWFGLLPLLAYVILALSDSLYLSLKNKKNIVLQLPFIYVVMHISYAFGICSRFFRFVKKRCRRFEEGEVTITVVKSIFGEPEQVFLKHT